MDLSEDIIHYRVLVHGYVKIKNELTGKKNCTNINYGH